MGRENSGCKAAQDAQRLLPALSSMTIRSSLRERRAINYEESEASASASSTSLWEESLDDMEEAETDENGPTPLSRLLHEDSALHTANPRDEDNEDASEGLRRSTRDRKTRVTLTFGLRKPGSPRKAPPPKPKVISSRALTRAKIESETRAKEKNFFLHNKDFFLPLLPNKNYIAELVDEQFESSLPGKEIPFEELETQPAG